MYNFIQKFHSGWAYLTLLLLVIVVVNSILGFTSKKEFTARDRKIALFGLIAAHIQLLVGLILYFVSQIRCLGPGKNVCNDDDSQLAYVAQSGECVLTNSCALCVLFCSFNFRLSGGYLILHDRAAYRDECLFLFLLTFSKEETISVPPVASIIIPSKKKPAPSVPRYNQINSALA